MTYDSLALRLGLSVETVKRAMWFIEWKQSKSRRQDAAFLNKREAQLSRRINKIFLQQMDYITARLADFQAFKTKGFRDMTSKSITIDMAGMFEDMPGRREMAKLLKGYAGLMILKGARTQKRDLMNDGLQLSISFDLQNRRAVEYLNGLETLVLSNKNGTINEYTKERIVDILTDGARKGESYFDIAKRIRAQSDAGVFSQARAELISTNEIGKAYEFGKHAITKENADRYGIEYLKKWQTVDDTKVTPECAENQRKGWIQMDEAFPSGDLTATRKKNPRCRCQTRYREASL